MALRPCWGGGKVTTGSTLRGLRFSLVTSGLWVLSPKALSPEEGLHPDPKARNRARVSMARTTRGRWLPPPPSRSESIAVGTWLRDGEVPPATLLRVEVPKCSFPAVVCCYSTARETPQRRPQRPADRDRREGRLSKVKCDTSESTVCEVCALGGQRSGGGRCVATLSSAASEEHPDQGSRSRRSRRSKPKRAPQDESLYCAVTLRRLCKHREFERVSSGSKHRGPRGNSKGRDVRRKENCEGLKRDTEHPRRRTGGVASRRGSTHRAGTGTGR